ncbi:MAG: ABC transporter ATP-binding protein [Anaerolineae bacterium]|nr:ABC transporter ATP-binding protein [Anaerolineae bacterium]
MHLEIKSVSKQYRRGVWGVQDVSLRLTPGVVGLLGPNGAGKTSLMNMLATITRPSSGHIVWDGADVAQKPDALRRVLGYLPQDFGVYPHLNAVEFLHYMAAIKGLDRRTAVTRIDSLLAVVGLTAAAKRPLGGYSGGMRQRVGIAQALLNDPQLLIVDEPTVGLDPEERNRFRQLIADLAGNRIIILSTHIVGDIEASATEIAILSQGRLRQHTTPEALLRAVEGRVWEWVVPAADMPQVRQRHLVSSAIRRSDGVHVRLVAARPPATAARPVSPTLEDAYLGAVHGEQVKDSETAVAVETGDWRLETKPAPISNL